MHGPNRLLQARGHGNGNNGNNGHHGLGNLLPSVSLSVPPALGQQSNPTPSSQPGSTPQAGNQPANTAVPPPPAKSDSGSPPAPGGAGNTTPPSGGSNGPNTSAQPPAANGNAGATAGTPSESGAASPSATSQTSSIPNPGGVEYNNSGITSIAPNGATMTVAYTGADSSASSYPNSDGTSTDSSVTAVPGPSGASRRQLSTGGAVSLVLITIVTVIGFIIYVMRRRAANRRYERKIKWFGTSMPSNLFGFSNGPDSDDATFGSGSGMRSARSSFGTNLNHGSPHIFIDDFENSEFTTVPLEAPPMAEFKHGGITHADLPTGMLINTSPGSNRSSVSSTTSNHAADRLGQSGLLGIPTSAMLVSPFTPTESWAFPSPPLQQADNSHSSWLPFPPVLELPTAAKLAGEPTSPSTPRSPFGSAPQVTVDPFADPAVVEGQDMLARRPFVSTGPDELSLSPGDSVRIVKVYDDGWAVADKQGERGWVPTESFDDPTKAVVPAGGKKRVSSQGAPLM